MAMDVFAPVSQLYPFSRSGEVGSSEATEMEAASEFRRVKRQVSLVVLKIRLGGTQANLRTDYDWIKARGGYTGFKFKDPWHYSITDEVVGVGDGSQTIFYLDYKYIDASSLVVELDDVETEAYTLADELGRITFDTAPGFGVDIDATYEFYRKFYFNVSNPSRDLEIQNPSPNFWFLDIVMKESLV
jgi:hypothetical protein